MDRQIVEVRMTNKMIDQVEKIRDILELGNNEAALHQAVDVGSLIIEILQKKDRDLIVEKSNGERIKLSIGA